VDLRDSLRHPVCPDQVLQERPLPAHESQDRIDGKRFGADQQIAVTIWKVLIDCHHSIAQRPYPDVGRPLRGNHNSPGDSVQDNLPGVYLTYIQHRGLADPALGHKLVLAVGNALESECALGVSCDNGDTLRCKALIGERFECLFVERDAGIPAAKDHGRPRNGIVISINDRATDIARLSKGNQQTEQGRNCNQRVSHLDSLPDKQTVF
jgi:hypothetical protein